MPEVLARQKDIQFSSRTRMVTDMYRRDFRRDAILAGLFARIGDADLSEAERAEKRRVARQPAVTILELIYQQAAYEGQAKDYDFSPAAMREHWEAGLRDARATLARPGWLGVNPGAGGIETHDIHAPAG
jgi:NTE family protein